MAKVGIVLSGGGIRGIAHLGVLTALTNAGIQIDRISGTSAGSIVGALYAQGIAPKEILDIFLKLKPYRFIRPALGGDGLLSLTHTESLFLEYLPHNSFEGLAKGLVVAATNSSEGKLVYFSSGPLVPAILASSAIPGVFKPIRINNHLFVDGGILNNFPVEPLLDDCDFIIGSSCNHLPAISELPRFRKLVERAAVMCINTDMKRKAEFCGVLIEPENLGAISVFDTGKAEEIYWIAYEETLKKIKTDERLKEILIKNT